MWSDSFKSLSLSLSWCFLKIFNSDSIITKISSELNVLVNMSENEKFRMKVRLIQCTKNEVFH